MEMEFVYARAFALEVALMELIKLLPHSLAGELASKLAETAKQYGELPPSRSLSPALRQDTQAQLDRLAAEVSAIATR